MKRPAILLLLLAALSACGITPPQSIARGSWQYQLLMNGVKIGTASVTNNVKEGHHVSILQMNMALGKTTNTTRQIITETEDFKPVKLEIYNTIINEKKRHEINTVAEFKGKEVTLTSDGKKTRFTVDEPFILDGNYFMNFLIQKKFRKGTKVSALLYDPSFEAEEPIRVTMQVAGHENILINGKLKKLFHIIQRIENMKNIDIYLDETGVAQKAIILMLNNRIELIIKE